MIKKHWGIIAIVGGAVLALWLYLRKGAQSVTTAFQPSAASSGVPAYTQQTQQYATKPNSVSPSPTVSTQAANTLNQQPAIDNVRAAQPTVFGNDVYSYNVPVQGDMSKQKRAAMAAASGAKENGCGCGSTCKPTCQDNNAQFTDGQGNGCMSVSRHKQIDNLEKAYPGVWAKYQEQIAESGFASDDIAIEHVYMLNRNTGSGMQIHGVETPAQPFQWSRQVELYKHPKS